MSLPEGDQNNLAGTAAEAAEGGSDEGNPGDGGKGGETPTLESLQMQLRESQEQATAAQMRLLDPDYQEFLQEKRSGGRRAPEAAPVKEKPVDPLDGLTDEKLNAMSNRDILATAIERSVELISSRLKEEFLPEVEARLSSLGDSVADQAAKRDVAETAAKYPDFWAHQKDMVALSVNPKYEGLGAEDLYHLVKAQKGGTAAAPTGTPGQRRAAAAHTEKPGTTGGGGAATGKNQAGQMEPQEAASDAWEKVFGKK